MGGGDPPTPTWAAAPGSHRPATSLSQILPSCRLLRPKKAQSASEHATERGGRAARLYPLGKLGDADGRRRGGEGGRKRTRCPLAYSSAPSAVAPSRRAAAANYTRRERGEEAAAVCDRCNDAGGAGRGQKGKKLPLLPLGSSAEPGRAISGVS